MAGGARCLTLAVTLPLLTWVGDLLALAGGLMATTIFTNMTAHTYIGATLNRMSGAYLFPGLIKTPFWGLQSD
jgi:phospholipid/cholesterol/gamma-HCH transport system permease protein